MELENKIKCVLMDFEINEITLQEATKRILLLLSDKGQSEGYHCELYEFSRCESPCARQCESCFWMESKR